jgi:transcriptional regulator with XRE-family HTH domain
MSTQVEKFWDWVNSTREEKKLSFRAIERAGGLSNGAVSKRESDGLSPTLETCQAVAASFEIPVSIVLSKAGVLPPIGEETAATREMIHLFTLLSDEDQERALVYLRAMLERQREEEQRAGTGNPRA